MSGYIAQGVRASTATLAKSPCVITAATLVPVETNRVARGKRKYPITPREDKYARFRTSEQVCKNYGNKLQKVQPANSYDMLKMRKQTREER